jgi:undecaprenyl-diphosphatase
VGLRIMVGSAIFLAGAGVFALLARPLGVGEALTRPDQALTDALRVNMPRAAPQVFATLTHLADTATLTGPCIVMALALITLGRRWLALGWVVALAGNGLLDQTLKQIFNRVRPLHPDRFVLAQGFSFPSGHRSGAGRGGGAGLHDRRQPPVPECVFCERRRCRLCVGHGVARCASRVLS